MKEENINAKPTLIIGGSITDLNNYLKINLNLSDQTSKMIFYPKKSTYFTIDIVQDLNNPQRENVTVKIINENGSFSLTSLQISSGNWSLNDETIANLEDFVLYLSSNTAM